MPMPAHRSVSVPKRLLALRGDPALVARARAGDVAAFEVVYERHMPAILSFCRHMLGSREEAEDAVQSVFVSAHRHLLADSREINLKPWLYAIARNRCLSMLRARREHVGEEFEVSTSGLHEVVSRRAELRSLLTDLADLPPDQRAALVLTELGDLSHAEVAEVLERREDQVKGLVFRARSGLTERRDARDADCDDIRAELASARGGGLRRGRLKHHLKACPGCSAYMEDLRGQRRMMGLILPVVPTVGLKGNVFGALASGGTTGAAAGAGALAAGGVAATSGGVGSATAGASLAAATVAKIAAVGALAGGAGVAVVAGDVGRGDSDLPKRTQPARSPALEGASPLSSERSRERVGSGSRDGRAVGGDRARGTSPGTGPQEPGARGRGRPGGRRDAGSGAGRRDGPNGRAGPNGRGSAPTRGGGRGDAPRPNPGAGRGGGGSGARRTEEPAVRAPSNGPAATPGAGTREGGVDGGGVGDRVVKRGGPASTLPEAPKIRPGKRPQ